MSEPKLTIIRDMAWVRVNLDDDGTPLVPYGWDCGERMIEVEPGQWQGPTMVMIEKYLREVLPDTLNRCAEMFHDVDEDSSRPEA